MLFWNFKQYYWHKILVKMSNWFRKNEGGGSRVWYENTLDEVVSLS